MLALIVKAFEMVPTWRQTNREQADQILAALCTALNETILYAERIKRRDRDDDAEEDLSRLWFKAAMAVRRVDAQLAETCITHGRYWGNPSVQVMDYAIKHKVEVDEAFRKLSELMRKMP